MEIKKKKEDRFKFLNLVYKTVNGQKKYIVDGLKIGRELNFDRSYIDDIYYYLKDENLITPMGAGYRISITHQGIIEVEEALSKPEEPTEHFPPVINFIQIDNMNGGTIQQGTNNSTVNIVSNDTINNINNYIDEVDKFVNNQVEDINLKAELQADIETIKKQLESPKPKDSIIKATLQSTKEVLTGAMGGVLGNLAQPKAQELINMIGSLIG